MIPFEEQVAATVAAHNFFATDQPIWVARAPGRLDVMGGNVDYTGGMVLQSLLREGVWVAVQNRTDEIVRILNPGAASFGWETDLEFTTADLKDPDSLRERCERRAGSRWACFVLGALHFLRTRFKCCNPGGLDLFVASDLPPNKGVSSSAALEIATLKAASASWGVHLKGIELATAGQWVENIVVGAACGIMDQAAIVVGQENRLLPLLCQPCQPFPTVMLPPGMRIWGIDSMVSRSTAGLAYETARAAAFMGYKLICQRERIAVSSAVESGIPRFTDSRWNGYMSNLAPAEFRSKYERWLPESLSGREFIAQAGEHVDPFTRISLERDYPVRAAIRYAVEENFRVQTLCALLEPASWGGSENSLRLIGEILCQSHVAYTDCGLGSEACDELVARALKAGFLGAKMTGGGAGGGGALFGRAEDEAAVHSVARAYAAERNETPYIFQGSSSGVDSFGVRATQISSTQGVQR